MSRKAGVVTINLSAGTAQFMADMDASAAKIRKFGADAQAAGHGTVSSMQASSAAVRELMGGSNLRAVERFVATTLGIGPILEKAFPVVGAVALGGVLVDLGEKAYKFYRQMVEGPARLDQAFRTGLSSLREQNDELAIANDRLAIEIAHLEGRHANTLALTLDEAARSADHLATSLEKDLDSLKKLLKEQGDTGFFQRLIEGGNSLDTIRKELFGDIEGGYSGFNKRVEQGDDQGYAKVRAAKTKDAAQAAQKEMFAGSQKLYDEELAKFDRFITAIQKRSGGVAGILDLQGNQINEDDKPALLRAARLARQRLQEERASVLAQGTNVGLTERKGDLDAARANSQQDRPFEDRLKSIGAQTDAIKAKLAAIGAPEAAQTFASAFGEAQRVIEEVNKSLERRNIQLSAGEKMAILNTEWTLKSAEAEAAWKTKLEASATSINDRIKSQELLTAAIGKGYDAVKRANVESRLMLDLGQHYNDQAWMGSHQGDVDSLRTGFGQEFDSQHAQQSAQAVDSLNKQIELERELATAQSQGAEAVRQATLAVKIRQLTEERATRAQIQAVMELYKAERENANSTNIAKINERIEATQRLTDAIRGGADAVRVATLANQIAEITRNTAPGSDRRAAIVGAVETDKTARAQQAAEAGANTDHVQKIQDQINLLKEGEKTLGNTLSIEIELRKLENERLQALAEQSLALGKARDGVRAFFITMQEDAIKASQIVYDALNSALDRTSQNLAKLLTGQKTQWAQAFKEIGEQMLESTIKSELQKGLGALGKKFGLDLGGNKNPTLRPGDPGHVIVDNLGQGQVPCAPGAPSAGGSPGKIFGGAAGGMIFNFLGGLLGGGGGGGGGDTPNVTSSIDFPARANGGGVDPGQTYMVGERGPEMFTPSSRGSIIPNHQLGGDTHIHNYHIDARGADLGAANRIQRGIQASHDSAVATSVRANAERAKRTPQR